LTVVSMNTDPLITAVYLFAISILILVVQANLDSSHPFKTYSTKICIVWIVSIL